jgi:O-antigen ligase
MPALESPQASTAAVRRTGSPFGYWVMVIFSFLYYFRPGDIIPHLSVLHMARITAVLAVLALLLGTKTARFKNLPFEIKIILAMFGWMILAIPFSFWRGGSTAVVFLEFSKAVMVALTLTLTVTKMAELRRLMLMQALGVGLMTIAAVIVNNRMKGRLAGVGDALLSNPNDLAMNIALNWPLCLLFLLLAKGPLKKLFWGVTLAVMVYALMATYSRAGFMALAVAILLCLWYLGIRGRRYYLVGAAALCLIGVVVVAPGNYLKRLETLVGKFQEGDLDLGSAEARKNLLVTSLKVTATHPIFGIGPGTFPAYTGLWLVSHNTYTQFSSECGIPALLLFLTLMWRAFRNLRHVRKMPRSPDTEEAHLYASALTASFAAYALGAFFSSSAYELFPYYMVIYTTLLYRLSMLKKETNTATVVRRPLNVGPRVYSPVG